MNSEIAITCKQISIGSLVVGVSFIILNAILLQVSDSSLIQSGIGIGIGICVGAAFIFLFGICFSLLEIYTKNVAEVELKQMKDLRKLRYKKWRPW